jgi:hypothetical protein
LGKITTASIREIYLENRIPNRLSLESYFPRKETRFPRSFASHVFRWGADMCEDYVSLRAHLAASKVIVVEPLYWSGLSGRTCWHHVKHIIAERGGSFVYGWALGTPGPIVKSRRFTVPLYARWVNHVLWSDAAGQLWEVTPIRDELTGERLCTPAHFILDNTAFFEAATDEVCCPLPAIYAPIRPEGQAAADYLCQAERATKEKQDFWVMKAVEAVKQAGFVPESWRVKRVGDKLRDVLIVANLG